MTLRNTFMCGNRLNCWNTIPILVRMCRRCCSLAGTSWLPLYSCHKGSPSTSMIPAFGRSSVMSSRKIVVFPEPLGPMTASFSPGGTSSSNSFRTFVVPKDLETRSNRTIGVVFGVASWPPRLSNLTIAHLQLSNQQRSRITHEDKQQPYLRHGFKVAEVLRPNNLG